MHRHSYTFMARDKFRVTIPPTGMFWVMEENPHGHGDMYTNDAQTVNPRSGSNCAETML